MQEREHTGRSGPSFGTAGRWRNGIVTCYFFAPAAWFRAVQHWLRM